MTSTDLVIRWSTAGAVGGGAAVAAVASYEHADDFVRMHSESGWTARLVPFTVDDLIDGSSALGIAATLAANVAHGLGHGLIGAAVAAWPAVALVGSYELLMMVIHSSRAASDGTSDGHDLKPGHHQGCCSTAVNPRWRNPATAIVTVPAASKSVTSQA
jgi:hypothetical protein